MSLDEIKRAKVGLYQILPYDLSHRIGVMNALRMEQYWDERSDRFDDVMMEIDDVIRYFVSLRMEFNSFYG